MEKMHLIEKVLKQCYYMQKRMFFHFLRLSLLHSSTLNFIGNPMTKYLWSQKQSGIQNQHFYIYMLTDIRKDKWHKQTLYYNPC